MSNRIRKIVVGTDFSAAAAVAVVAAGCLATTLDAELVVAHTFDPMPVPPIGLVPTTLWPSIDLTTVLADRADREFAKLAEDELKGVSHVTQTLRHANPASALCDYAAKNEADLLVVGTLGASGLEGFLLGSVAKRVVRHSPCAALAVRSGSDAFPSHMVVCTDFSPAAEAGVELASDLAAAMDSRVTIVNVQDPGLWRHATEITDAHTTDDLQKRVKNMLDELSRKQFAARAHASLDLDKSVPHGIIECAERVGGDLIVLATHGRTGVARFLLGSVAERVTQRAACSVLVARSSSASFATTVV